MKDYLKGYEGMSREEIVIVDEVIWFLICDIDFFYVNQVDQEEYRLERISLDQMIDWVELERCCRPNGKYIGSSLSPRCGRQTAVEPVSRRVSRTTLRTPRICDRKRTRTCFQSVVRQLDSKA